MDKNASPHTTYILQEGQHHKKDKIEAVYYDHKCSRRKEPERECDLWMGGVRIFPQGGQCRLPEKVT